MFTQKVFDVWRYLPFPWGVVALRGIQNQGFYFFEVEIYYSKSTFDTVFPTIIYSKSTFDTVAWSPSTVRLVVIACGASATSEKTRPGNLEYVSCGFCRFLSILGSPKWCRHRMTPTTATSPTTATPHSHQHANTHRDQISRSDDTPSL